jgi:hypothetical protein
MTVRCALGMDADKRSRGDARAGSVDVIDGKGTASYAVDVETRSL